MKTLKTVKDITKQQLKLIVDLVKDPMNANISFIIQHQEIFEELEAKLFPRFLIKYPEIKNLLDIYKIINEKENIWEVLDIEDKELIIKILKENKLINEKQIFKLLNLISIHFIFIECLDMSTNKLFKSYMAKLKILNELKNLENKLKDKLKNYSKSISLGKFISFDKNFSKIPSEVFEIINHLKIPARKPVTTTINLVIKEMVEIAKEEEIKNHYADFVIPLTTALKC